IFGIVPSCSPLAGFVTGIVPPPSASHHLPAMKHCCRNNEGLFNACTCHLSCREDDNAGYLTLIIGAQRPPAVSLRNPCKPETIAISSSSPPSGGVPFSSCD